MLYRKVRQVLVSYGYMASNNEIEKQLPASMARLDGSKCNNIRKQYRLQNDYLKYLLLISYI